jgi:hypothetical protein
MGLRIAVQEKEGGTGARYDRVHRHAPGIEVDDAKTGENLLLLDHGAIMPRYIPSPRLMPINGAVRHWPKKGESRT